MCYANIIIRITQLLQMSNTVIKLRENLCGVKI
jgi:hypothetical protein